MARSDVCVSHDEPDLAGHSFLSPQLRVKWAEEEEERLRRPEHQVLKVDAPGRLSPFLPVPRGCLPHPGSLQDALCHPKSLLWPRGHLVLGGSFETTFYVVGAKRFSALPPKEKFVGGDAPPGSGVTIEKLEKAQRAAETLLEKRSDHTGTFFMARRRD